MYLAVNGLPSSEMVMRLALMFIGMAMGISGSSFAAQVHERADANTAAVVEAPATPCPAPATAEHAINTKGTGTAGRVVTHPEARAPATATANHAINIKGTGSAGGRVAMNSGVVAPASAEHVTSNQPTGCNSR